MTCWAELACGVHQYCYAWSVTCPAAVPHIHCPGRTIACSHGDSHRMVPTPKSRTGSHHRRRNGHYNALGPQIQGLLPPNSHETSQVRGLAASTATQELGRSVYMTQDTPMWPTDCQGKRDSVEVSVLAGCCALASCCGGHLQSLVFSAPGQAPATHCSGLKLPK